LAPLSRLLIFEFAQQFLLALGQVDRGFDHHVAHQVAVRVTADALDAFAAQAEDLPDWVSAGILMAAAPSSVGISISPPRLRW
jgi:hypothetical protein